MRGIKEKDLKGHFETGTGNGVEKAKDTPKSKSKEEPEKDTDKDAESSSKKELKDKNDWRKDIQVVRAVELLQGWQVFKGLGAQ
jgi:hypothetical protein